MPTKAISRPPTRRADQHADLHPEAGQRVGGGDLSWRTVRGISASRLGRCMDEAAASSAETTKISDTLGSSRKALTPSTAVKHRLRDAGRR